MQEQYRYPNYPPNDNDIDFAESTLTETRIIASKKIKVCPVCQFPIHIRIILQPCHHYLCMECFEKNKYQCSYCMAIVSNYHRTPDYQDFYSCQSDTHQCYKYFSSSQELQSHMVEHFKMNWVQPNSMIEQKFK